jgi:hypothetical protein
MEFVVMVVVNVLQDMRGQIVRQECMKNLLALGTARLDAMDPNLKLLPILLRLVISQMKFKFMIFSIQGVSIKGIVEVDKVNIEAQTFGDFTYSGNGYIEGKYITLYLLKRIIQIRTYFHACIMPQNLYNLNLSH